MKATSIIHNHHESPRRGFTIVELLIVIVVIAILAAITLVAYNGIQTRANDTRIRDAAAKFATALQLWAIDHGSTLKGNWGSTTATLSSGNCSDGSGSGFAGSGAYQCTTEDFLRAGGYLPANFTSSLPRNTLYYNQPGGFDLMIYGCGAPGLYALYWTLQQPTSQDTTSLNTAFNQCDGGNPASQHVARDSYGMRAARIIQL